MRIIEPKDLLTFLKNEPKTLVPNLPSDVLPAYSLRESEYFSSQGVKPNFKMISRKANLYQKEQMIHARNLVIEMPDHTRISALEGVYYLEKNQINFYGSVHTVFQNGATLDSEFATAFTKPVAQILIPISELVNGHKVDHERITHFTSYGLTYDDHEPKELHLLSQVRVKITDDKTTEIFSDQATYQQEKGHLWFLMNESRPLGQQFVKVKQIDLDMKSRRLEVEINNDRTLDRITGLADVWIRDSHDPKKISISTSGKAIYYQKKNDVLLTDFPQVYQEGDTITGDLITFHRTTDLIEVQQSNGIYNNDEHPAPAHR